MEADGCGAPPMRSSLAASLSLLTGDAASRQLRTGLGLGLGIRPPANHGRPAVAGCRPVASGTHAEQRLATSLAPMPESHAQGLLTQRVAAAVAGDRPQREEGDGPHHRSL